MFLDFSWVAEPTAWGGLGTLILLEVVLGIDNLVFISILSSRLPEDKRRHAFTIGLSLALIMRFPFLAIRLRPGTLSCLSAACFFC